MQLPPQRNVGRRPLSARRGRVFVEAGPYPRGRPGQVTMSDIVLWRHADADPGVRADDADARPAVADRHLDLVEAAGDEAGEGGDERHLAAEREPGGDAEAARQLDEQIKAEIARIRERGERKKEKVRRGE